MPLNITQNTFLKSMEEQDRILRKFSIFESSSQIAITKSINDNYKNLSAAEAWRKLSMHVGESETMKVLNRSFSVFDTKIRDSLIQPQFSQLTQVFTAVDALSLASKKFAPQNEWHQKMDAIFSPLNQQSAAFKLFHEQTTKIAQIFDPSVSAYLRKNVRTVFDNVDSINPVEAIYLKSFEELGGHITEDISEQIAEVPGLMESIRDLATEFANTHLYDKFIDKLVTIISDKLGMKKSFVVKISGLIVLYFAFVKPHIEKYKQSKTDERQDTQIGANSNSNVSQDKKTAKLKFTNQQEDELKITKETLHNSLNKAIPDFEEELMSKFGRRTVKRYTLVAASFVDYLNEHTEYSKLEKITKVEINNFVMGTQYDVLRNFDKVEIVNKLDSFLVYLNNIDTSKKDGIKSTK